VYEPPAVFVEPEPAAAEVDYGWTPSGWDEPDNDSQDEILLYTETIQEEDYGGDGGDFRYLFPDLFPSNPPTRQFSQAEPPSDSMENQSLAASALGALVPKFIETGI
ncbi:MAG: hypothetical protein Q8Q13_00515, partial [bacterium]|nr:hypothetical protein [bacterium]